MPLKHESPQAAHDWAEAPVQVPRGAQDDPAGQLASTQQTPSTQVRPASHPSLQGVPARQDDVGIGSAHLPADEHLSGAVEQG